MTAPYAIASRCKNDFDKLRTLVLSVEFILFGLQAAILVFFPTYASRQAAVGAGLICAIILSVGWTALLFWQAGQQPPSRQPGQVLLAALGDCAPYLIPALFVVLFSVLWVVD